MSSLVRIFENAPDRGSALDRAHCLIEECQERFTGLAEWLEETIKEALAVLALACPSQTIANN
jgi:hypothetical protein